MELNLKTKNMLAMAHTRVEVMSFLLKFVMTCANVFLQNDNNVSWGHDGSRHAVRAQVLISSMLWWSSASASLYRGKLAGLHVPAALFGLAMTSCACPHLCFSSFRLVFAEMVGSRVLRIFAAACVHQRQVGALLLRLDELHQSRNLWRSLLQVGPKERAGKRGGS